MPQSLHSCPATEGRDQQQAPSQLEHHQQKTFEVAHGKRPVDSRTLRVTRFASKCRCPASFRSRNWTTDQPRHKIHRFIQLFLSHLSVSGRRFTVRALITPVRVPTSYPFVPVDRPSQMPRSHDEPSLPSWAPDSFARTASPKLSNALWNLLMVNPSTGVVPLDRSTNLCLKKL